MHHLVRACMTLAAIFAVTVSIGGELGIGQYEITYACGMLIGAIMYATASWLIRPHPYQ